MFRGHHAYLHVSVHNCKCGHIAMSVCTSMREDARDPELVCVCARAYVYLLSSESRGFWLWESG